MTNKWKDKIRKYYALEKIVIHSNKRYLIRLTDSPCKIVISNLQEDLSLKITDLTTRESK